MDFNRLTVPMDGPAAVLDPLVSIVMPCVGQLEYTKLAVPSVLRCSRQPFELIFLDIGSLDGTVEYLEGLKASMFCRVEIVRAMIDLEIADACRDALSRCRGEYIVLLNNDTIVTPGWLSGLTSLAKMTGNIGLVGPMSNYAAPPQLVESVGYRSGPKKSSRIAATHGLIDAGTPQGGVISLPTILRRLVSWTVSYLVRGFDRGTGRNGRLAGSEAAFGYAVFKEVSRHGRFVATIGAGGGAFVCPHAFG